MTTDLKKLSEAATHDFAETQIGTLWVHKKTGGIYVIFGTCRIEATNELGILYHSTAGREPLWCRPLAEFLDGRFAPATALPQPPEGEQG